MDKSTKDAINKCLTEIRKGDRESVNTLYDLMAPYIRYIALQYTDNTFDADDLIQDFWRDIFKTAARFVNIGNGYAYLCNAMQKRAEKFRCKNAEQRKVMLHYVDYSGLRYDDENVDFKVAELKHVVGKAIDELSENEKTVLQLCYFMNMSSGGVCRRSRGGNLLCGRFRLQRRYGYRNRELRFENRRLQFCQFKFSQLLQFRFFADQYLRERCRRQLNRLLRQIL